MPKLNESGVLHILLLVILIIGIIAGVYLVGKTQIFKPKASSQNVEWVTSSGDSGNCVTNKNGETVTTCPKVKFKINIGLDGTAGVDNGGSPGSNPVNTTGGGSQSQGGEEFHGE